MFNGMVWLLALSYALNIRAHDWEQCYQGLANILGQKIKITWTAAADKTKASNFKKVKIVIFLFKKVLIVS
jgi:hypothetical protein